MRPRAVTSVCAALLAGSVLVAGCGGSTGGKAGSGSSSLKVVDAPVGQATDLKTETTPVLATFAPASKGAPVAIQEKVDGSWKDVAQGKQSSAGRFLGQVPNGAGDSAREFRARTEPGGGDAVTTATAEQQPMKLVWNDEFDGDSLDSAKWATRVQPAFGRRMCAMPDQDRVEVKNGSALLTVKKVRTTKKCPYGFWYNAMIGTGEVTKPGFQAAYGVFAARVKFQHGQGMHGSFWIQGAGADSAEIDVAEYFGDGRADGGLSNFVHRTDADGALTSLGGTRPGINRLLGGQTPADDWHVYSVEWSPKGYVFRLDGEETFRTSKKPVAKAKEFLVLSLLTSDYELPRIKDPNTTMKVDWVRAWQQ